MEIKDALKASYLADGCSDAFLEKIEAIAEVKHFSPGDVIVREEDPNHDLMLLVSGDAEVFSVAEEWLGSIQAGMPFGEIAFLDGKPRSGTVIAKTECEVLVLPEDPLRNVLRNDHENALRALLNLSRVLCHRIRRATKQIAALQALEEASRG